jgi:hypothetical protein
MQLHKLPRVHTMMDCPPLASGSQTVSQMPSKEAQPVTGSIQAVEVFTA